MAERTVVKEVAHATRYSDGTILVKNVRLSYPHVLIAKGGTDKEGKPIEPSFSIMAMLPKGTHRAAKDLVKERMMELLRENKLTELPAKQLFLTDGNEAGKAPGKQMYKEHFLISARESKERPPKVRDVDGRTKLTEADVNKIYGGCWGNVLIRPWFQKNKHGTRVNAGLSAVQFLRDDAPFGEGRLTEEAVDDTFSDETTEGSGGAAMDDIDTDGL